MTLEDAFLEKAKIVHGLTYDYSNMTYAGSQSRIKIICRLHGEFEQKPEHHLQGNGCQKCGNLRSTRPEGTDGLARAFLKKAKEIHGDKYGYLKMKYNNCRTAITIVCTDHGEFLQKPSTHLRGSGWSSLFFD